MSKPQAFVDGGLLTVAEVAWACLRILFSASCTNRKSAVCALGETPSRRPMRGSATMPVSRRNWAT